ncbi:keratin, type I cytoskeletal 18-like [Malurus melanocephalus]|uniref:keratin, type I cytoskeletal 18-like n=1 Tax=Malurus melanocephalus TaxID=175006 RepID=UPI002546A229|nr:keratin, type I cytoskeletal 18-like [Malurus melanocephalus]
METGLTMAGDRDMLGTETGPRTRQSDEGSRAGSTPPLSPPQPRSRGVPRFEAELAIRLSVDGDIAALRKVLDDTNMTRLQLEGDIEALREELILLRKEHDQEVQALRAQVAQSALTVEVDAPRSQDLGKVLGELRAQYDALAQKNLEDLEKQWGQQVGNPKKPKSHPKPAPKMVQDNALVLERLEKQRGCGDPKNPKSPQIPPNPHQSTPRGPQ